jgi:predicted alpha/beta superfamily hydrolase
MFMSSAAFQSENVSDTINISMLTLELYTPSDDLRPIYVVGNFNGWKPEDETYKMEKIAEGKYRYVFLKKINVSGPLEYKYVKGGWESEELGSNGESAHNRRMEVARGTVRDTVPIWKKHENWYDASFYPKIEIISKRFVLPQLGRRRRISILLPHNYYTTKKKYPVLYLQDGQNLFEDSAPFGTWGVDKKLAYLAQHGKGDFIVVAIDHGGKERINEFSPYDTQKWGEGLGKSYATFLAETLKPYIDKKFRTLTDRLNTGIGGSSMGGLISIYAGLLFPQVFSKFMVFSPSLWISPRVYADATRFYGIPATKIYLYAGGSEGTGMVSNALKLQSSLEKRGLTPGMMQFRLQVDPSGKHNEARWGQEFPMAAEWLFFKD